MRHTHTHTYSERERHTHPPTDAVGLEIEWFVYVCVLAEEMAAGGKTRRWIVCLLITEAHRLGVDATTRRLVRRMGVNAARTLLTDATA